MPFSLNLSQDINLRPLLLQPPLKDKTILGLDPAYRTGCKIAVIDEKGNVLDTAVVFPTPPQNRTEEAAKVFAEAEILLLGNESQTVGPEDAPMAVHLILLGADVILLEGIRLAAVSEGVYLLNAAPLNLSGADGSPCRAVLIAVAEK